MIPQQPQHTKLVPIRRPPTHLAEQPPHSPPLPQRMNPPVFWPPHPRPRRRSSPQNPALIPIHQRLIRKSNTYNPTHDHTNVEIPLSTPRRDIWHDATWPHLGQALVGASQHLYIHLCLFNISLAASCVVCRLAVDFTIDVLPSIDVVKYATTTTRLANDLPATH
ncbi:MAG TPA: hypothetical protein VFX16_12800 [Pseudonocardiaceae bacterium]|nr:hypothetical protein [Pseudonocardiaceae bacterium]